jgi:hypothetical protein
MKKLIRRIFKWAMDDGSQPSPVAETYPFRHHSAASIQFSVVRAENGILLQTYDYSKDMPSYWVIPEGTSIGSMVDTVLVEKRLTK